jgi:GNAT superfamily N-acetyltransferase
MVNGNDGVTMGGREGPRFGGFLRRPGRGGEPLVPTGETGERVTNSPIVLREMNLRNNSEMQSYISFLNDPRNVSHFANTPKDTAKLREWAGEFGNHFFVGTRIEINAKGEAKGVVVGGFELQDAAPNQQDHFLSLFVVDPDKQGQGIGGQMLKGALDMACETKTQDDRWRDKLDLAIVMGVPGWRRMEQLVLSLGQFRMVHILRDQVDVLVKRGDELIKERKPVKRYEADLKKWRNVRGLPHPVTGTFQ